MTNLEKIGGLEGLIKSMMEQSNKKYDGSYCDCCILGNSSYCNYGRGLEACSKKVHQFLLEEAMPDLPFVKSCPFCGEQTIYWVSEWGEKVLYGSLSFYNGEPKALECRNCGYRTPASKDYLGLVRLWNRSGGDEKIEVEWEEKKQKEALKNSGF